MRLFMHRLVHVILTFVLCVFTYIWSDDIPTFSTSLSYSFMAKVMPERDWSYVAAVFALIGLLTCSAKNSWVRIGSSFFLAIAHAALAYMFYLGNPHAAAFAIFGGNAVLAIGLAYSTAYNNERYFKRGANGVAPVDIPRPLAR